MNRKMRLPSSGMGRDSRSSFTGSTSKLPRSTPLLHSTKKVLPSSSTVQKPPKRSSYFGTTDHRVMKDTRPLSDKSHMKKCVQELLAFLSDMNYPNPLTLKMLSPPTNKEYFRIFEFMYSRLSPSYKMVARPDEETAKILYDLNYPFSVSKSTLSNIGTMSAWPHALGALHWLMELVKYNLSLQDMELHQMVNKGDKKQELLLSYLGETYTAFMLGRNEPYDDINEYYSNHVEELNKEKLREIESLKMKAKEINSRRNELKKNKEEIYGMEQRLQSMQTDKKHFADYFEEFKGYYSTLENKLEVMEANYAASVDVFSALETEVKELQSTVTAQELSVADMQKMKIEISQMESSIKTMENRSKELEEQFWEKQIERSKLIDKLDPLTVMYMEKCRSLQLVPETAPNVDGVDYSLKSADMYSDIEQSNEKLIQVIRPKLMTMKTDYLSIVGKLQRERNHSVAQNDQLREQVTDEERLKSSLTEHYSKVTEEVEKVIAEHEKNEEAHSKEIQNCKDAIECLKTVTSLSIEDLESQLKNETTKLKEAEIKWAKESKEFTDCLLQLAEACIDQKARIHKKFQEFNQFIKNANEKHAQMMAEIVKKMMEVKEKTDQMQRKVTDLENTAPANTAIVE